MSRSFNPDWKRSYWPEPRFGKRVTRASVVREVRARGRVARDEAAKQRVADALAAD